MGSVLFALVGPLGRGGVVGGCLTSGSVVGGACFDEGVCLCGLCPFWNSFFCLASGLRRDGDGEVAVLVDLLRLSVSWIVTKKTHVLTQSRIESHELQD